MYHNIILWSSIGWQKRCGMSVELPVFYVYTVDPPCIQGPAGGCIHLPRGECIQRGCRSYGCKPGAKARATSWVEMLLNSKSLMIAWIATAWSNGRQEKTSTQAVHFSGKVWTQR